MQFILVFIFAFLFLAPIGHAAGEASKVKEAENLGYLCDDLSDVKKYEQFNLEHFSILEPGKDEWIFRTKNDFYQDFELSEDTIKHMQFVQSALRHKNVELVLVIPPVKGMLAQSKLSIEQKKKYKMNDLGVVWKNYEAMIAKLNASGIPTAGLKRNEAVENFFYKRNHHWSAYGAQIMAKEAALEIKKIPSYSDVVKAGYITKKTETIDYDSSYTKAFESLCETKVPQEKIDVFTTSPKVSASDESALFGGDGKSGTKVFLVGTSNSVNDASKANFEGFLKQNLETDVINYSVVGAGIDTSMVAFLNSTDFKTDGKKIVLWEIPGYYNLNLTETKVFDQAIPAAYGACNSPILEVETEIELGKEFPLFSFNSSETKDKINQVASKPLYLHFTFETPIHPKFNVRYLYENEEPIKKSFSLDSSYSKDKDFYMLVPTSKNDITAIRFYTKKKLPEMTVSLCAL